MIINLKPDIFSKFLDNELILENNEIGIFLFLNGDQYLLGKFSKEYNLSSIIDELKEFYHKISFFDRYEISQEDIEFFIKDSEIGTYIKNGEVSKMKPSQNQLKIKIPYKVQVLCGNDTAHVYMINSIDMDFNEIIDRIENCEKILNPISLTLKCDGLSIVLFKDGKALIREKNINEERVKLIYERIIFHQTLKFLLDAHNRNT
ncbi:MAG: hypothetical protein N2504_06715 [candidate division WOR-3 bacterium]|nr:hypothetical protein [candidate division WOR-3 bacterium]MCX7948258.1 hypothetical protein [candidate division WOR-3 bacterium]MDW8151235.1 hypothetical protein [candidate division WOR-3 bacterium]